tara:strand:- start:95 stop:328 length:234 start_codon:yes stop_codon:yes gene_type:complete
MDMVYFLVRFTPFWSIPCLLIGLEFTYLYWIRKKKKKMMIFFTIVAFSAVMTVFYWVAGGPEKSVEVVKELVWFYTR